MISDCFLYKLVLIQVWLSGGKRLEKSAVDEQANGRHPRRFRRVKNGKPQPETIEELNWKKPQSDGPWSGKVL
jgi:hypothetical protein